MKSVSFTRYGPPEVLQLRETEKPVPKADEVLIRIHASTVNSGDVRMRKADPFLVRFMLGLRRPKKQIPGIMLAGVIESAGEKVTNFKTGDRVYGMSMKNYGAHAEYISLPQNSTLAPIPEGLSYAQAAAIPFGTNSALHFLRKANAGKGKKVLVYGASGSVGVAAVQLAKYFGCDVTAICSTTNMNMVKELGADNVIDYTKEDFSNAGLKYDIIFDAAGKSPFEKSVNSLTSNGVYCRIVHMSFAPVIKGMFVSAFTNKKIIGGVAVDGSENLIFLNSLIQSGKITPVIDRIYPIEEIVEAHRYVEAGHKKGNVVLTMEE